MNPIPAWGAILTPNKSIRRLNYQFAIDRAYVSRTGPLPSFSRTTAASYVDSSGIIQYADVNVPRIDFHPITGVCRGLLHENQVAQYCRGYGASTGFVVSGASSTYGVGPSPDGNNNAALIAETAVSAAHTTRGLATTAIVLAVGDQVTVSVFVKKGAGATAPDWINLGFTSGSLAGRTAAFNVATGTVGTVAATNTTASIVPYNNGWYRCIVTGTTTTAGSFTSGFHGIAFTNNANTITTPTYLGNVTSDIFVWGWQVEYQSNMTAYGAGKSTTAYATSFIRNPASNVMTKGADFAVIQGANLSLYNPAVGVVAVKVLQPMTYSGSMSIYAAAAPPADGFHIGCNASLGEAAVGFVSAATTVQCNAGSILPAYSNKSLAFRYESNNNALSINGGAVITDNIGAVGTGVTAFAIGQNAAYPINGWIQALEYYNAALTNAELQALSAL
jgi:hypothetical protein